MAEHAQVQGLDGVHMLSAAAWDRFEGTPDVLLLYKLNVEQTQGSNVFTIYNHKRFGNYL